jgi:hypothetical protein
MLVAAEMPPSAARFSKYHTLFLLMPLALKYLQRAAFL